MLGAARLSDQIASDERKKSALFTTPKTVALVALVAAIVLIVINVWVHPKLVAADAAQLSAAGLALTSWGLVLALGGFGITWWQIHRSTTAAQAVANAVSTMRRDYAAFDVITELRTARAHTEGVITALAVSDWPGANKSYWGVRVSLMKMASSSEILDPSAISACKDYVADILTASDVIQQNSEQNPELIPAPQLVTQMTEADNFLISLEQQLKGSFRANR